MDLIKIRRALVSVSDKTGVVDFCKALSQWGVELISTGGTAKALREAGLTVKDISEHTGFPEMLDGRVKTLHPKVHGGLLARRDLEDHMNTAKEHGIEPIDIVIVNLYPFEATVAKPDVSREDAIADTARSTRNYAKRQLTWFRNQEPHAIRLEGFGDDDAIQRRAFEQTQ